MRTAWSWRVAMKPWSCTKKIKKAIWSGTFFVLAVAGILPLVSFAATPKVPAAVPPAEVSEVQKVSATILPSDATEAGLNKAIFLDLRDINVVDVFKFLATQGNLNIVTSKNVQGRSTLLLRDVKIKDALDILVISNQLAYEIRNDIIYIMTEDEYAMVHGKNFNDKKNVLIRKLKNAKPSYVLAALQAVQSAIGKVIIDEDTGTVVMIDTPEKLTLMEGVLDQVESSLEMKVLRLEYAKVEDVVAQLKPQIEGRGVGTVLGDPRSNQVILSAYPGRMEGAVALVKALDKQIKGVLIETRILQLTLNPKYDFGVAWDKLFRQPGWHELDLGNSFYPAPFINSGTATASPSTAKVSVGNFGVSEFAATIKMVKEIEDTKLLANPRVMTLDRQEAKINVGDRLPYVVTTSTGTGNNISVSEDIRFIDIGIMMSVTPTISDNGSITMKIRPEIASQTGVLTTAGVPGGKGNEIPKVNTTFIDTTVIVQDGVSIVLGGLIQDQMARVDQGVPYLMDIPFIGNAFKSRHESIKKTEIVIIITPHIVTGEKDILDHPLPLRGKSSGNGESVEFHTTTMDMFNARSADAAASKIEAKEQTSKPIMAGLSDDLSSLTPVIKRTK